MCKRPFINLNEYLPLKQGLRLEDTRANPCLILLNEYLPLKQGLRPAFACLTPFTELNEYLPLKQGLRHS